MKIGLVLILTTLVFHCSAQTLYQPSDSLVSKFKINFALPDLPAFKSLDNEPSKILRPSTTESFSALASEFYQGNQLIIPKSYGIEISPLLLANSNRLTLRSYQKNPLLYSTRISFGTFRNDQNASTSSLGFRLSAIDKGDAKNDKEFLKNLTDLLSESLKSETIIRNNYLKEKNYTFEQYATVSAIKAEVDSAILAGLYKPGDLDKKIENLKKQYKEDKWNAQKLDFAFAFTGYSNDTLAQNIKYKSTAFWITWALPIMKFGQLLLGNHLYSYKDFVNNNFYTDVYLNSRLYIGTNRIKGFAEFQYSFQQKDKMRRSLFDFGAEINISDGMWIDFYTGIDRSSKTDKSEFVSSLRMRFSLPETFKY